MRDYDDDVAPTVSISPQYIINLRTAFSFRFYVIYINILAIITLIISVKAYWKLTKSQVFSPSITHLLQASLIYSNLHNLSYCSIETWSLYRSFVYSTNYKDIMFTSEECFVQHVFNSCSRFLLIAIELALNFERIIAILLPRLSLRCVIRGEVLSVLSLVGSLLLGWLLHLNGPHDGVVTTSCFREYDLSINMCTTNLVSYIILASVCFLLDMFMVWYISKQRRTKVNSSVFSCRRVFDLKSTYNQLEQYYSLLAVSLTSIVQLIFTLIYAFSLHQMSRLSLSVPGIDDANTVRWFYTTPYTVLFIPMQLLIFMYWIGKIRRKKIEVLKNEDTTQDGYFQKLKGSWDQPLDPKQLLYAK